MSEKSSKLHALKFSLGNGRVWVQGSQWSPQCTHWYWLGSWHVVLSVKCFQNVGELLGIPFTTLWPPNILHFSICLSLFYVTIPYISQSSSSNDSLKLLLIIFLYFSSNLSSYATFILSTVTRAVCGIPGDSGHLHLDCRLIFSQPQQM